MDAVIHIAKSNRLEELMTSRKLAHWRLTWKVPFTRWMLLVPLLGITLLSGCTRTYSERGVEPAWRALEPDSLRIGTTTRSNLLAMLGPPSQVISQADGEIFYYLHEESESRGLILVVYNKSQTDTRYDRAIFFLDAQGVLRDFAIRDAGAPQ
jgi:outer membrane protein assembly factor BamE (lipoprotein component of BamABCDE complex)